MATSIKEQIIQKIGTRLANIQTANFYETDIGTEVLRESRPPVSSVKLPCVGFHPDINEKTIAYGRLETRLLPLSVQGLMEIGTSSPPQLAEKMSADIEECILTEEVTLGFDSGGHSYEIVAGDDIIGESTGAVGKVISIATTSGAWNNGNAAGTMTLRRTAGIFTDNELIKVGAVTNVATVNGQYTGKDAVELSTNDLADKIQFVSSKSVMPESDGAVVGAVVLFNVEYKVKAGNPYSQVP